MVVFGPIFVDDKLKYIKISRKKIQENYIPASTCILFSVVCEKCN